MSTLSDAQLEELFGTTLEEIEQNAAPWESGELAGTPSGPVQLCDGENQA